MNTILIYTTNSCPYCIKAKQLLDNKGINYTEHRIDKNPELLDEVVTKSGGRTTVPQIFINDRHIGGCDDLYELDKKNKLDSILGFKK